MIPADRLVAGPPLRPGSRLARPGRARSALLLAGAAAALVALALWWLVPDARGLTDRSLVGPRGPACERLVVAVDQSGSMRDEARARDEAFGQLLPWAGRNLRPDDEVVVVDFAAEAAARFAGPATGLSGAVVPGPVAVPDGQATLLAPVLDRVRALGPSSCDTALLLLSDGELVGVPPDEESARTLQRDAGLHDLLLLVPDESLDVLPEWSSFPPSAVRPFDGTDADATAEAFGEAIGALTHQTLASG